MNESDAVDARARRRVLVTVDGLDPASTRRIAEVLAAALRAEGRSPFRAKTVDFAAAGGVDGGLLRSALLDPFLAGESFALRGSRADGDVLFDPCWTAAPGDAILLVEGTPARPRGSAAPSTGR